MKSHPFDFVVLATQVKEEGKLHEDVYAWNSLELFMYLDTHAKKSVAPLILLGKTFTNVAKLNNASKLRNLTHRLSCTIVHIWR